jgi:hypothetical protein
MIMADVLAVFLVVIGLLLMFVVFWLAAAALFPCAVDRAEERYARPIRTTLWGLLVFAPLLLLGIVLSSKAANPALKLLGAAIALVPLLLGLFGSAGLAQRIGRGLPSPTDATEPWRRVLRGGSVLALTFLLPFFGQFFLIPWALVSGTGAAVMGCCRGCKKGEASPHPSPAIPPVAVPPVIEPPRPAP